MPSRPANIPIATSPPSTPPKSKPNSTSPATNKPDRPASANGSSPTHNPNPINSIPNHSPHHKFTGAPPSTSNQATSKTPPPSPIDHCRNSKSLTSPPNQTATSHPPPTPAPANRPSTPNNSHSRPNKDGDVPNREQNHPRNQPIRHRQPLDSENHPDRGFSKAVKPSSQNAFQWCRSAAVLAHLQKIPIITAEIETTSGIMRLAIRRKPLGTTFLIVTPHGELVNGWMETRPLPPGFQI